MTYFDRLHPWCIIRLLPNMQRTVVARFRDRGQAEEYLRVLRRLTPQAHHILVFDPPDRDLPDAIGAAILPSENGRDQHTIFRPQTLKFRPQHSTRRAKSLKFRLQVLKLPVQNSSFRDQRAIALPQSRNCHAQRAIKPESVTASRQFTALGGVVLQSFDL